LKDGPGIDGKDELGLLGVARGAGGDGDGEVDGVAAGGITGLIEIDVDAVDHCGGEGGGLGLGGGWEKAEEGR
jgi:hypothetical protein